MACDLDRRMSDLASRNHALLRHDEAAERAWERAIAELRAQGVDTNAFIARAARNLGMIAVDITGPLRFSLLPRVFDETDETDENQTGWT